MLNQQLSTFNYYDENNETLHKTTKMRGKKNYMTVVCTITNKSSYRESVKLQFYRRGATFSRFQNSFSAENLRMKLLLEVYDGIKVYMSNFWREH